ncbi:MAG: capsid assembly protease [Tardiphaga sp.]|nr:capsid assembly protease [Tardiphaga sp.]
MTHLARIADMVINRPLLVLPSKLSVIAMVLDGRIGIEAAGLEGLDDLARTAPEESRFVGDFAPVDPRDPRAGRKPYRTTAAGVAILPLLGSLVHRASYLDAISGMTSYEKFSFLVTMAAEDPDVASITIDIDSPGGQAIGAFEAADVVRAAGKRKPVVAVANGLCCSAAYAIASAATRIVATPSSVLGSIGVVLLHADHSKRLDKAGVSVTLIHAGARKVDGHPYAALTDEVAIELQAEVNRFMDLFVETVQKGRAKLSAKAIRATEAKTFLGVDAVAAGLADEVGSFVGVVEDLNRASPIRHRLTARHMAAAEAPRQRWIGSL